MRAFLPAACFSLAFFPALAHATSPTRESLHAAFGGETLDAVDTFSYRLTIRDELGVSLHEARYRLEPGSGRLHMENLDDASQLWWDGEAAWRLARDGAWSSLAAAPSAALAGHARSHFLRLWRDPATRVLPLQANRARVQPAAGEAFEITVSAATGLVERNRFDDGTRVVESDYRRVEGVMWPMRFTVESPDGRRREARFDEVAIAAAPAIPTPVMAASPHDLDAMPPDGALRLQPGRISSARSEYNLSQDAAARVRVFARSDADFANARIWIVEREGEDWGEPREIAFTDPRYRDSDPWLTPDGRVLYFVSDRPAATRDATRTDLDLWRVERDAGGAWASPTHLGEAINSPGYELGPELHDEVLYFNSTRAGGPAGLSLYRAPPRDDGSFGTPEALPAPFNTGAAQGDFTLSPDGRVALFWSIREGREDGDLFAVRRDREQWAAQAVRLPPPFNSPGFDFTPSFSADGRALIFASDRAPKAMTLTGAGAGGLSDLHAAPTALLPPELGADAR